MFLLKNFLPPCEISSIAYADKEMRDIIMVIIIYTEFPDLPPFLDEISTDALMISYSGSSEISVSGVRLLVVGVRDVSYKHTGNITSPHSI